MNEKLRQIISECINELIDEVSGVNYSDKFDITRSKRTRKFKELSGSLPREIQRSMMEMFEKWKESGVLRNFAQMTITAHARRYFKLDLPAHYRAIAIEDNHNLIWIWVGSHENYNKLWTKLYRESIEDFGIEPLLNTDGSFNL